MKALEYLTDEELAFIAKEGQRLNVQLARARQNKLEASLTLREWILIIHRFGGICVYCRKRPFEVMDHLVAVERGGGTTAENCLPACSSCNVRKQTRSAHFDAEVGAYIIEGPRLLKEKKQRSGANIFSWDPYHYYHQAHYGYVLGAQEQAFWRYEARVQYICSQEEQLGNFPPPPPSERWRVQLLLDIHALYAANPKHRLMAGELRTMLENAQALYKGSE